jgi:hypothetical protein
MQPRMEERNRGTILGISGSHLGGLTAITVKAGSREILKGCGAVQGEGHDMINGKGHVLPLLCRMAVLTECPSALSHLHLHGTWEGSAAWHPGGVLSLSVLARVSYQSVQEAQIVIEFFILVKFRHFVR